MAKVKYRFLHDRRNTGRSPSSIELYVYFRPGSVVYLPTGTAVDQDQWDSKNQKVVKHPRADFINAILAKQLHEIEAEEYKFILSGREFTPEAMRTLLAGESNDEFTPFCRQQLSRDNRLSPDSKRPQYRFLNLLDEFKPGLTFSKIDFELVYSFDNWIKPRYSDNTVKRFHKDFKKFITLAVNMSKIKSDDDPYRRFKVPGWKHKTEFLYPWEVEKILATDYKKIEVVRVVRDAFVFACYTGLRHSDLHQLTGADFEQRPEGLILNLKGTKKTDTPVFLRLYEMFGGKAQQIITPYLESHGGGKYIWGRYVSNQYMNEVLKTIQTEAGLSKKLTVHLARHTFGTLYAKQTGSIFEVMRAMAIKNFKTAQIYINLSGMI